MENIEKKTYRRSWLRFLGSVFLQSFLLPGLSCLIVFVWASSSIVGVMRGGKTEINYQWLVTFAISHIQYVVLLSAILSLIIILVYKKDFPEISLNKEMVERYWLIGVGATVACLGIMLFGRFTFPADLTKGFRFENNILVVLIANVIVIPFINELIYRHGYFRLFPRKPLIGLILSIVLFIIFNLNFLLGESLIYWVNIFFRLPLTFALSYLYYEYRDFVLVWGVHTLYNFSLFILFAAFNLYLF